MEEVIPPIYEAGSQVSLFSQSCPPPPVPEAWSSPPRGDLGRSVRGRTEPAALGLLPQQQHCLGLERSQPGPWRHSGRYQSPRLLLMLSLGTGQRALLPCPLGCVLLRVLSAPPSSSSLLRSACLLHPCPKLLPLTLLEGGRTSGKTPKQQKPDS